MTITDDLIAAYDEYVDLLGESEKQLTNLAYSHGFRWPSELVRRGEESRAKIASLKERAALEAAQSPAAAMPRITDEQVERAAKVIYEREPTDVWADVNPYWKTECLLIARAALEAAQSPAVADMRGQPDPSRKRPAPWGKGWRNLEGPSPEQEVEHLAEQCDQLLRENKQLRAQEGSLRKRPIAWCIMDDNVWRLFGGEADAYKYSEEIGSPVRGLYMRDGTPVVFDLDPHTIKECAEALKARAAASPSVSERERWLAAADAVLGLLHEEPK